MADNVMGGAKGRKGVMMNESNVGHLPVMNSLLPEEMKCKNIL